MTRAVLHVAALAALAAGAIGPVSANAQATSPLAGVWTLNRSLSELPRDIGFNASWVPAPGPAGRGGSNADGGGRSRGGNRGSSAPSRPESYDDAQKVQVLSEEVRTPPTRLTVVDSPTAVTITNELGQSRVLHPDGKEESIDIQGIVIGVTSRRDGDQLVALFRVDQNRQIRYTFSSSTNPSRLVVDVQFLERNIAGDKARRVYDPGIPTETSAPSPDPARAASTPPTGAAQPPRSASAPPTGGASAAPAGGSSAPAARASSGAAPPEVLDQRPGAEFKGLHTLGILVEDPGTQAVSCGLKRDTIEGALSKRLTDNGFVVHKNSDEDTYVYINIVTNNLSDGLCVSRYDAFLYSNAPARLSYHDQPVLVQVSLLHRGGINGGAPSSHGQAVQRSLEEFIDIFATEIHNANK